MTPERPEPIKKPLPERKGLDTSRRQTYLPDRPAGISTMSSKTGCCGIAGPVPSATLDKFKDAIIRLVPLSCQAWAKEAWALSQARS